jgi:tetratricopeptide (TPR) repeat protein
MKKQFSIIRFSILLLLALSIGGICFYVHEFRIPKGPKLPPNPPLKTEFSQEAVDLNEKAIEIWLLTDDRDPEEGLRLLNQSIEIEPDYLTAYGNKCTLLMELERWAELEECCNKLIQLQPRDGNPYLTRAYCLYRQGKEKEVKEALMYALSAANYQVELGGAEAFNARLMRVPILHSLGKERLAQAKLDKLEDEFPEYLDMTVSFRECFNKAIMESDEGGYPWSLFFDE